MKATLKNTPADDTLDALGNPVRREILRLLAEGPRTAGDIAQAFPISRPAISKHLRILQDAGVITHDSVGTRNLYRLNAGGFDIARNWLDSFWDDALHRLAFVAENTTPKGDA